MKNGERKMSKNERMLTIITSDVKEDICQRDVITPEIFANVFLHVAKEHDVEYEEMARKYISGEVEKFLKLQTETTDTVNKLSQNTTDAINAIESKDENTLKSVLSETKSLKKELERLKESLHTDELTNVYNRKWLFEYIVTKEKHTFKTDGVVALVDLNYFKQVNDTYGHIVGDKVLVFIASQLKRSKGSVVRYGGDEFLIFFEGGYDSQEIRKILSQLREDIVKKHLKARNAEFRVSFSIGVAKYFAGEVLEEVIERADTDMYEDKKEIKKRITGIEID